MRQTVQTGTLQRAMNKREIASSWRMGNETWIQSVGTASSVNSAVCRQQTASMANITTIKAHKTWPTSIHTLRTLISLYLQEFNSVVTSGSYIPLTKSLFKAAGIRVSQFFSMLPSTVKYLYSVEPVRMHFPAKQPCTNDTVCNAANHLYTAVSRENAFWLVQRNRDTSR